MRYLCAFAAMILAAAVASCSVKPNTKDTSKPVVVFKVRNADGQYVAASSATLSAGSSNSAQIICTANDSGGMKSATLSFSNGTSFCTVGSSVFSGSFTISPVPASQSETATVDAMGNVTNELFFLTTVQGPFTCNVPGQGTGTPFGNTITGTCTGTNWSSKASAQTGSAKLTINLQ